jgi:hypothetical protein
MTTLQLTLAPAGRCRGEGCACRLSVADTLGLCVNCAYALEMAAKRKPARLGYNGQALPTRAAHVERRVCKCGRGFVTRSYRCAACNREKTPTVPECQVAGCHAPRVVTVRKKRPYCEAHLKAYDRERVKEWYAREGGERIRAQRAEARAKR